MDEAGESVTDQDQLHRSFVCAMLGPQHSLEPWVSTALFSQVATAQFGWTSSNCLPIAGGDQTCMHGCELFRSLKRKRW